jgi:hypothetical protein
VSFFVYLIIIYCFFEHFLRAEPRWKNIFAKALIRPFRLFAQETIIQVLGIYMAFIYGLFYRLFFFHTSTCLFSSHLPPGFVLVFLTTIPTIFADIYHEAPGIAGLHYIALGVGLTTASQINARLLDRIYIYFKNKNGGVGQPEFRLRKLSNSYFPITILILNFLASMVPASIILPIGLLLSGWAAQQHLHWIATDIVR